MGIESRMFPVTALSLILLAAVQVAPASPGLPAELPEQAGTTTVTPALSSARSVRNTDGFNFDYLYGITRGMAASRLQRSAVVSLSPITVALDTALLPFATLMGIVDPD